MAEASNSAGGDGVDTGVDGVLENLETPIGERRVGNFRLHVPVKFRPPLFDTCDVTPEYLEVNRRDQAAGSRLTLMLRFVWTTCLPGAPLPSYIIAAGFGSG